MEVVLRLSRRATYADYLAAEQDSVRRHEFIDGVIVAMAGGSDEHNALTLKFGALCAIRLTAPCRAFSPDQRFWIAARGRGRYADGSIVCGPPEHPPHDGQATTNPVAVFEVLSPSTEGDDDGDKRTDFQSLASLRAYVLVAQDERRVKVYRREDSSWTSVTYRDGDSFDLPSLDGPILVDDIYDGILDRAGRSLLR
jgi:Uma2 family endonuclease